MSTKILIIDHNDSFTYNLLQLFENTNTCIATVCPYHTLARADVSDFDGIVFSPGPGLPDDYPVSMAILKRYISSKPVLGVCLGFQILVRCAGGELYNLQEVKHGRQVDVYGTTGSRLFNNIQFPMKVGLYHSWAMDKNVGNIPLQITSTTEKLIPMSVQHKQFNAFGVQFHPESYMTKQGLQLAKNWLEIVAETQFSLVQSTT